MSSECGLDHNAYDRKPCTCTQDSLSHCHLLSFAYLAIAVPEEREMILGRRMVELPRHREGTNQECTRTAGTEHVLRRLWEKMLSSAELPVIVIRLKSVTHLIQDAIGPSLKIPAGLFFRFSPFSRPTLSHFQTASFQNIQGCS